ncbi:unnamed protein product [Phytomonas sp. Hart1]|nr:unnamed protein product [Phytomonas sp. Hart1]|eukprot:CCW67300.1 unnamed protein product [Phytomonas sp. isolate Hart1]
MSSPSSVKLNNFFIPKSYALEIEVDLSTWSYRAREDIILKRNTNFAETANSPKDVIRLHVGDHMKIEGLEGGALIERDDKSQTVSFRLEGESAAAEEHRVTFIFSNSINPELRGFYRVTIQENGKEVRMASTHFEPTSARLFYICQDEPASRADFTLRVLLPKMYEEYTVISNGKLRKKEANINGQIEHEFDMISQCPPYLTACIVGRFESISATSKSGIPISVFTTPGKLPQAQFALQVTTTAVDFFQDFFRCKYPLPKLDLIAVPDFPIGGMENWGCITCVEAILVNPGTSSVDAMKRASELLCHEVSHNWFGNLVAINWWEGLWLKEGFASWCGYYAAHVQHPEWDCLSDAAQQVSGAMTMDMSEHSHPVEVPIQDPAEITEIFDSISYNKGMGLVFMLQCFLGPKWEAAVAYYINKYQFKDTKTVQLWLALEESSGVPVNEIMSSFTTKMGYPVVFVQHTAGHKELILQQKPCKYVSSGGDCTDTWCIPVIIESIDNQRTTAILRGREPLVVSLPPEMQGKDVWLTANPCRSGFYRCYYEDNQFKLWLSSFSTLKPADKRVIITDTFAGLWMGQQEVLGRVVALGKVLRDTMENNTGVLMDFSRGVFSFAACFDPQEKNLIIASQLSFIIDLAQKRFHQVATNAEEEISQNYIISTALSMLLDGEVNSKTTLLGENPIVQWAIEQAKGYLSGDKYSNVALEKSLTTYVRVCDDASMQEKNEQLLSKLTKEDGNDETLRALITSLCMSQNTEFVKDVAVRCMHNDGIRSHFGGNVFVSMANNIFFKEGEVWNFFKERFVDIDQQWGKGQFRIQVIVSSVGSTLKCTEANAVEYANFFKNHPIPNARLEIARTVEKIGLKSWMRQNWLKLVLSTFKI